MSYLSDNVLDNGIGYITSNTENFYLLSADPGTTWANIATYTLGSKASPTIASPSDRTAGGREVVISAITDGSVSATGTATHFALTDDSASEILVVGALSTSQGVSSGNTFTTTEFTVAIPDPA